MVMKLRIQTETKQKNTKQTTNDERRKEGKKEREHTGFSRGVYTPAKRERFEMWYRLKTNVFAPIQTITLST